MTPPLRGRFFLVYKEGMKNPQIHPEIRIVALHGAGMSAGVWEGFLPDGTALSLPGHGAGGGLLPAIEGMADWAAAQLGREPVVLMGHSMGALVALETALRKPVAGLILLGAAAKMPVHPDLLKQAKDAPEAAADLILKWGVNANHPDAASIKAALKTKMHPDALFNDLSACNDYSQGEAAARKISIPVLVMTGADDKLTKAADGAALARLFPQGRFLSLPACGHMLMAEKPEETATEIRAFVDGLAC